MKKVKEEGMDDKMVIVGGVIPASAIYRLKQLGVSGIFPGGTPFSDIVAFLNANVKKA